MVCPTNFVTDESSALKSDHTFSQGGDYVGIVCCHKDGDAKLIDLPEQLHDLPADERIKVARRFVCDQQLRVPDDCSRDRSALLFAARERVRVSLGERSEPHNAQGALNGCINLFAWRAGDLKRKGRVLANCAPLQESEVLEDHANASAHVGDFARLKVVYRTPRNVHLARARDHITNKEADQRGLSCTRRPHKEDKLTTIDGEADTRKRGVSTRVLNMNVSQGNNRTIGERLRRSAKVHAP